MKSISVIINYEYNKNKKSLTILLAIFMFFLGYASIPFLPLYLHYDLHSSMGRIGLILSFFGAGTLIASFYGGKLCDYFSAYYICVASLCVYLVALATIYFMSNSEYILELFFLLGIGSAAFSPASRIFLMRSASESEQSKLNVIRYILLNVGTIFSFIISSIIIKNNYREIFPLTFSFCLATLCIFIFLKPFDSATSHPIQTEKVNFLKNRYMLPILAAFFVGMLVFSQLNSSYSLFLQDRYHLRLGQIASLFIINSSIIVLMQMPILAFFKKLSQFVLMSIGSVILGVGFLILPFGSSYYIALISICIITVGEMMFIPVAQNLIYYHSQNNHKGYYMGIYQLLYSSTGIFTPFLSGHILDYDLSGFYLWGLSFFLCLVPGLILKFFKYF